ncbi:MAG: hypothetical protein E6R03_00765 [Hyphomicrobiaceae bacterium]|nr:MAG: hypothetical protein E6R03_00765 [Hyphomicrobiaceae bacterium]
MMNPGDTILPAATAETLAAATFSQRGSNAVKASKTAARAIQVSTTDDYPWGRQLRCVRSMWLELDGIRVDKKGKRSLGKGFRVVTQTIDPRDGRVCDMKAGTYCADGMIVLYTDAATGYTEHAWLRFNGDQECAKAAAFLAEHPEIADLLPPEAHEYCWHVLRSCLVGNARYTPWLPEVTKDQIREALCLDAIMAAIEAKAPITALATIGLDAERINALTSR